jgi:hypothetical protein
MPSTLKTTASDMMNGADAFAGAGQSALVVVSGTFALNDTFSITLTTPSLAQNRVLGNGFITNANPSSVLTFKKKIYLVGDGTNLFFSALQSPSTFNALPANGNGFMDLSSEYGFSDDVQAVAIYQGKLAVFARRSIQVVGVDPDPAYYSVPQTLENIGTVNGNSVRSIGDTDVLFCSDSGIRSLRVRDSSGNLTPADLGTPIDSLIQARLLSAGTSQMASIVEPISNRYWLSIGNLIYVFSYFPSGGITAWSTYDPSTPITLASAVYATFPGGYWTVSYTGLTVGKTYRFTRGSSEIAAGITACSIADGVNFVPYLANTDGTFVATETTAKIFLQSVTQPANATAVLSECFTPEKFVERAGQVYVRSTDGKIYLYGGSGNATYDASVCSWESPWLDARSAAVKKLGSGMDAGLEGGWALSLAMDATSGILKEIYRSNSSSFGKGVIPSTMKGEFFKVRGVTTGSEYARFSSFAFHFNSGDSR